MKFPVLISGQLAQYSATRSTPAQHLELFFEGYTRQTHRITSVPMRTWRLAYSNLLPEEALRLRAFFESLPVNGEFEFTDPWTGEVFTTCRLANDRLTLTCDADNRYAALVEVEYAE